MKTRSRLGMEGLLFGAVAIGLVSCDQKKVETTGGPPEPGPVVESVLISVPLKRVDADPEAGDSLFTALSPAESGIHPLINDDPSHPLAYLIGSGMEAGGVAVGDVDGDGLPDLFFASSPGNNRLYRQVAPLRFEDITKGSGLDNDRCWSRGGSLVDIDNDGDLDLYVANYAEKSQLFINLGKQADGKVKFDERAEEFGLDLQDACLMPAFCDYDRDGDLDVYVMSNQFHWPDKANPPALNQMIGNEGGKPVIKHPYDRFYRVKDYKVDKQGRLQVKHDRTGRPNYLMRNDGGKFKDVTEEVGMKYGHGRGLSPTWWDYNDDGYLDLYVANDWADRDFLYQNNGDGTFRDVIEEAVPYTSMFTMGSDAGDLNNDGRIDLIAADMSGTTHYKRKVSMGSMQADQIEFMLRARPPQNMRNAVYLNTGTERLLEGAYLMGLANSDWSWAVKIADLDNDGLNDVFITNGMEQNLREIEGSADGASGKELRKEKNLAFRNEGDLYFKESGKKWGLDHFGYSIAAAHCDFDRDGDLDLFVVHRDEPPTLYRNTSNQQGVLVKLKGSTSNTEGIGATVELKTTEGIQIRRVLPTRGYLTSDEAVVHFGLGSGESIEELVVTWPTGHSESFKNLPSGHLHVISEAGNDRVPFKAEEVKPLFKEDPTLAEVRHVETNFDDFAAQPLLPNKLSQLGPGLASADLDGDGDDDVVLGGSRGSATRILINQGDGKFGTPVALAGTEAYEDMGVLVFDVDADGDRDLFVVSGGIESSGEDLCDRLYLNDGKAGFTPAPKGVLPKDQSSGGPVAAADIDRDGDVDLFVGCRTIPGQYPLADASRLLINEGGKFTEKSLADLGMVTGATFSDLDGDGWQDLLISREWGPVACFKNEAGSLVDATEEAGLSGLSGWWNGVASADLDNDGDMDFVATNFGYNTKYHASSHHPVVLYYGKFGTDKMRLVEAEYEGDELLPVRGKSCSTQAIPHLAEKFKTFHDFALANVTQIYSKPVIDDALKFSITTLASGVFLNDGKGSFEFKPLPRLAQIAPGFGIVIGDFDFDGTRDLFLAQNFFNPQPETGRMSGGLGAFLKGRGDGTFESIGPLETGLAIQDDAKAVCLSDFNGDSKPDFLVASNNGPLRGFTSQGSGGVIRVVLKGKPGNPDAFGAGVILVGRNGDKISANVSAGSGYLSQSSSDLFFPVSEGFEPAELLVRWPDGADSEMEVTENERVFEISQSD